MDPTGPLESIMRAARRLRSRSRLVNTSALVSIMGAVLTLVLLPIALNLGTGGTLPTPFQGLGAHAWPLIGVLAALTVGLTAWQAVRQPRTGDAADGDVGPRLRDVELAELGWAYRDLVQQVRRTWIDGVLRRSLDGVPRLRVELAERPGAVLGPWDALNASPPGAPEGDRPIEPGLTLVELYHRLERRLLILGDPGSGKTVLLLELAAALLEQADARLADGGPGMGAEPVPAVFHLSTWRPGQPISSWLVEELHARYGVSRRLARAWIGHDRMALLLDGLDEVVPGQRDACARAINEFRADHGQVPLVISARSGEYEALPSRLRLHGAIVARPLAAEAVDAELARAGETLTEVRAALAEDPELRRLLVTPLLLGLTVRAYRRGRPAEVGPAGPRDERSRLRELFAAYVDAMLDRPRPLLQPAPFTREQSVRWLSALARALRDQSEVELSLERVGPRWLAGRPRRLAAGALAVAAAALAGALAGALTSIASGVMLSQDAELDLSLGWVVLAWSAIGGGVGLLLGLLALRGKFRLADRLTWTWAAARRWLPSACRSGSSSAWPTSWGTKRSSACSRSSSWS